MTSAAGVTRDQVLDQLRSIFADVVGTGADEATEAARLADDLDIDSLLLLEMGVEVNDRFGLDLTDEDLEGLETVGDVVDLIVATTAAAEGR